MKKLLLFLLIPLITYGQDYTTISLSINKNNPSFYWGNEKDSKWSKAELCVGYGFVSETGKINFREGFKYKKGSICYIVETHLPKPSNMDDIKWGVHFGIVLEYSNETSILSLEIPVYNTKNTLCQEYNSSINLRLGVKI